MTHPKSKALDPTISRSAVEFAAALAAAPERRTFTERAGRIATRSIAAGPVTTSNILSRCMLQKRIVWLSAILLAGVLSACAQVQGVNSSRVAGVQGAPGSANDIATGGAGNRTASGTRIGPVIRSGNEPSDWWHTHALRRARSE